MNEKIQTRLEVMQIWADLAETAERKIEDTESEIKWQEEVLAEEEAKDEGERSDWRIKDHRETIARYKRRIEAVKQVQAQILKLMG